MAILLLIIQIVLGLLCLSGGGYKLSAVNDLAAQIPMLSSAVWGVVGVFEMVCGALLVVTGITSWKRSLTPPVGVALVVENLILAAVYARYSTAMTMTNPMPWAVALAAVAALVAYGRSRSARA